TRAGSYGVQAELERLIDEYYEAARGDVRRVKPLAADILERARAAGLDRDCGIAAGDDTPQALQKLDGFLCELKDLQIRDGLHVFGESPEGERLDALLLAFARTRRGTRPEDESLLRAVAADLDLGADPLMLDLAKPWTGPRPTVLSSPSPAPRERVPEAKPRAGEGGWDRTDPHPSAATAAATLSRGAGEGLTWRTAGDTLERLEGLALRLVSGAAVPDPAWQ